ncbi:MAG: hypothetical protein GAK43_01427 [Stenotrophomonas maltophilia]|nr:MAG: hypothetical protein GAK43_01427 [Stenotrophomonas maltophilia]
MSQARPILITGARAPVALDIARACRAAGLSAHLADSVTPFAARALRPHLPIHRLPRPRDEFAALRRCLLELIERWDFAQIIPTCEEVFWLAEAAARDGWSERLFAPAPTLLRTLHSKAQFNAFAADLGIAVPPSVVLDAPFSAQALPFATDELVLKPEYSRFATHTLIAPTAARLARVQPSAQMRWVAQQRIRGEEFCSWAAVHQGRVLAFAAYRPRWRQGQAAAFQMEAVNQAAIESVTQRIAAATGMTGHLSFDLIIDASGQALPLECNPRAVSGLHLFDAAPALAQALLGEASLPTPPLGRLRHMGPAMALLGLPTALLSGRSRALCQDWRNSQDVIDREGGGRVTLGCLADALRFTLYAVRAGLSPAGATTADIEWDGQCMP